ncbi:bola domain-containing protein [Didymella exigua CBS 183.55]|uniref:Bola domain-containing protein n=1 Tax=Didymella exigua CBS 183.55 TaxID=1150837 RepID=A0A6A5RS73_9PLEO|nr:bola domain-containing protein [Didymella exigua CBS 183.55]KAF1930263.1 bola domain-containing protein [Didymella exigua CBS 183.55]
MDPRHKLTKSLDQLFVDSTNPAIMSARTDDEAARNAASSGVTPEAIKQKLMETLGATHVEIEDMSGGCGQMFEAIIVSPQFTKKTTLARHRLVNAALKEEIAAIHAWTPKCYTPEQWEEKKPQ